MATYVLVHGSNQGGWIWQPVANLLRAVGHRSTRRASTVAASAKARCVRVSQPKRRPTKWRS